MRPVGTGSLQVEVVKSGPLDSVQPASKITARDLWGSAAQVPAGSWLMTKGYAAQVPAVSWWGGGLHSTRSMLGVQRRYPTHFCVAASHT